MTRLVVFLIVCVVALSMLVSAGPTLIGLTHAAVPVVIAVGSVVIALRIVWHFTSRY